jgi:hypothetical protein
MAVSHLPHVRLLLFFTGALPMLAQKSTGRAEKMAEIRLY